MIWSGFLIGLVGSFHCVGMCGPIAMALPLPEQSFFAKTVGTTLYNIGRAITYAVMGIIFGLLGKSFVMVGWQQYVSIAVGVGILLYIFFPKIYARFSFKIGFLDRMIAMLKSKMGLLFSKKSYTALFGIGLLNGLLPCGFVYAGIAGAIALANPFDSMLFMFLFGLGTFPVMFTVAISKSFISLNIRNKIKQFTPVMMVVIASLFILRGMNLGIPYISPSFDKTDCTKHSCCHKK